jgi:hypothetical protein
MQHFYFTLPVELISIMPINTTCINLIIRSKYADKTCKKGDCLEISAGRPKSERAFRVRTKAWFFAVSQASGMNAEELEIYFAPHEKQELYRMGSRPRLWEKYRDMHVNPKSKDHGNGDASIVQRVEAVFPGTDYWITLPFWRVLSSHPMEMRELKNTVYWELADPIRKLVVMEGPRETRTFWRSPIEHRILYKNLAAIGDIDAATAVLDLIKEAETTQNQQQHQDGLRCWSKFTRKLNAHPILSLVLDDINNIIVDKFTRISYVGIDGKYYSPTKENVIAALHGEKRTL